MITLDAQLRDESIDNNELRKEGKMPAVFYGKKTKSTPITIERKDFIKIWSTVGESGVVTIKSPTGSVDTLIHAVDIDPVSDIPRHADFYVFEKGKKIEISVPLDFIGVSSAIKDLGGSLVKTLHELKISADPQHIPHDIKVDISPLVDFSSQILASQINLPEGVVLVELPYEVVASAAAPKEDEPEEVAPVDLSAIEVEKKGKKDEEGVSGEEASPAPETK
ncbi:MAG: 50S ribosomal protein L25 [Candidatus Zambryskibacteria bacterium]|nr:50S ribosomal protein L25 [Candidatus Zambryskibacteria bacterium]